MTEEELEAHIRTEHPENYKAEDWEDFLKLKDVVNHPDHYTFGPIETIDFIEAKELGFHLGNVVKYVSRAEHKGKPLEDLKKAQWYLNRYIEKIEAE
jgi:hypothetical protein